MKGVSQFCREMLEKMPGFCVEIQDGRVRLRHIFLAKLWSSRRRPLDMPTLVYQKLIDVADDAEIDAGEFCISK